MYDLPVREVAVLLNEKLPAGVYVVQFDASRLPGGMYFVQLQAGKGIASVKIAVVHKTGLPFAWERIANGH